MASVETLSVRQFLRYLAKVFKRAGNRWWTTKGKHWVAEAAGALTTALVESQLGSDPAWWHSAAAGIGGGAGVALLVYLGHLAITPALIDREQSKSIGGLLGNLDAKEHARSAADRIRLYKLGRRVISDWGDLAELVERDPQNRSARELVDGLRARVKEISELVMTRAAGPAGKYTVEVTAI